MFRKVLVANRGEIALRVIRACRELGVAAAAVFSEADASALHVRAADEAHPIGPPQPKESYLNMERLVETAVRCGADAVHPGYGFLSENWKFAEACERAGIAFIGPSSGTIRTVGDKLASRAKAGGLGIPVVPGSAGAVAGEEEALRVAETIGYPVMLKASGGGGGRGMRVVRGPEAVGDALRSARAEAEAAFGNPTVYIEKFMAEPRHIEFQFLGDGMGGALHLGERECTLQRRHQKLLEEAPSPVMTPELRGRVGGWAASLASSVNYRGAGTAEFIFCGGSFYFLEVNARVQVEHPVTEMVTGVDVVKEQMRAAAGEGLTVRADDVAVRGHAIECRINAEDPESGFAPCPGLVERFQPPSGPGVRVDTAMFPGAEVPPYYDSLIAKVIAWGRDRGEAGARMRRALNEFTVTGVKTTIPVHMEILRDPDFLAGRFSTGYVGALLDRMDASLAASRRAAAGVGAALYMSRRKSNPQSAIRNPQSRTRWKEAALMENLRGVEE